LLLWGPIFSALTGAGGAIVRDVIRADAIHPTLHYELYAEISLLWGFILSLFILNYADVESINLVSVKAAVALIGIGCLATRVIVIQRHIKAPLFASRSKQRWKPSPSPIRH
jgi:polar amino acid transport system substrate-binding protein